MREPHAPLHRGQWERPIGHVPLGGALVRLRRSQTRHLVPPAGIKTVDAQTQRVGRTDCRRSATLY
ncbi:hypothetical protein GFS60_03068 [Rhodococcus sp. WAY2]|nr:hypothetical protein GFS60_03068 [Rhodococcus sp. WAY2]